MSYLVLARKYRPQTFSNIVGQSHVWKVLKNAIKANRIAHAYIFAGPRGTGKTTTARIFAKALNCSDIRIDEPCGNCPQCKEIMEGSAVDVLEIDGASNRGIDEIRELRQNVKFAPASLKYKIYIIDEAHQITEPAFNALLKTLEEPPARVIFIMATTEPQKIPSTILSRCQRFKFRPLSTVEIAGRLKMIIKEEKFKVEDGAVGLIAVAANGSLRDSLSMLDQIIPFSAGETVTEQTVRELLGLTPVEMIESLVELSANNDSRGLLKKINQVADEGYDFIQVCRDLRDRLRNLVVLNYTGDDKEIEAHYLPEEMESLRKQKDVLDTDSLMRGFHLMNKCLEEIRWSDAPRLVFELFALKFASGAPAIDELIKKLEQGEDGGWGGSGRQTQHGAVTREEQFARPAAPKTPGELFSNTPAPANVSSPALAGQSAPQAQVPQTPSPSPQAQAQHAAPVPPDYESCWAAALNNIRRKKPLVSGFLETCGGKRISGNKIIVTMCGGLGVDTIRRNLYLVEPALSKAFGRQIKMAVEEAPAAQGAVSSTPGQTPAADHAAETANKPAPEQHDFEAVDESAVDAEESVLDGETKEKSSGAEYAVKEKNVKPVSKSATHDEVVKKILKTFSGKIIKDGTSEKNPAPDKRPA